MKKLCYDEKIGSDGKVHIMKLTPYERKVIKQSIKEENDAVEDYARRGKHSKNPKVKKMFSHIRKEEIMHSKEFNDLLK